jgi:hypothetical protein
MLMDLNETRFGWVGESCAPVPVYGAGYEQNVNKFNDLTNAHKKYPLNSTV